MEDDYLFLDENNTEDENETEFDDVPEDIMEDEYMPTFSCYPIMKVQRAHDSQYQQKIPIFPNSVADLHPHERTLPPPCFIDPTRFLGLNIRKLKIDSKLIGMVDNSTFLVPIGL
ncbi:hypothetical protein TNCV_3003241 [Trichonephila clavipes]|nr:hypothetical protein TNCV_3003241 [Trichonephila clavipes]